VKRHVAGVSALAAVLTLGACGTTYVDSTVTVPDTAPDATTTTLPPVDPDAPIDELLVEIETLMFDLDERAAERQIRAAEPNDVYNFEQAIELARSGVERNRPADASKGYKILTDVIDAYLDRT
jgi:hypothetical protein